MKISAIICEFNPIHTGHKLLIDYAKSISDKVICVMSGNFTQRGLPACADKYDRARHAILCGADLVVELPTIFATSSAENFAFGGVAIAKEMGADLLVFGSECGDVQLLQQCASMLNDEEINLKIKEYLSQGQSYPKAVSLATGNDLLSSPNNTLAIEYLRAIKKLDANLTPITITRNNDYNSLEGLEFASSTALRKDASLRKEYTFDFVEADILENIEEKFCDFATHYLTLCDKQYLAEIEGVAEGIENKILTASKSQGYNQMLAEIKSKRYTRAKLQRIVFNSLLRLTKSEAKKAKLSPLPIRPLAVKSNAVTLLQLTNDMPDIFTQKADNLYLSFSGKKAPTRLQKLN